MSRRSARSRLRGVLREDSDDELGYDDLPWEPIFPSDNSAPSTPSKRGTREIVGARMGDRFELRIGDTVLIKGEGVHVAYVGMVCEFLQRRKERRKARRRGGEEEEEGEREGEMQLVCNVQWFCTEAEIRGRKKRDDFLPVSSPPGVPSASEGIRADEVRMNCISTRAMTRFRWRVSMEELLFCRRRSLRGGTRTVWGGG